MKKAIAVMMAALIVGTAFAGCSKKEPSSSSTSGQATAGTPTQSQVTVKFLEPGTKPKDYDLVAQKINEKLKADGTGIQVERTYIAWDAWAQKTNLMLSTGEEFDLFPVMADQTPFSTYYAKGALAPLNDAIDKYGSNIKKNIPAETLKAAEIDQKLVTIPANWMEYASEGEFDIRVDLLKKNNLSIPTTPDELLKDFQIVQKNWTGSKKLYFSFLPSYDPLSLHTTALHRTYQSFPFTVEDGFFYVDQNSNVKSWFETPEFKQDCDFMHKAYTMGLINPDILTYKQDQLNNDLKSGNWFVLFGTGGDLASLQKNNPQATNSDVKAVYFNPDKAYIRPLAFKNSVSVSSTSTHVNEAVKFINWLYTNQSNYDLYFYGIEGKHFKADGARGIQYITDPANNNSVDYSDSDWMSGNMNFERVDNRNNFTSNNDVLYKPNDKAVNSVAAGLTFNASKVQAKYTNIQTEAAASMTPLVMGVQGYDKYYASAIQRMKSAGLEDVVKEYQAQFKTYLAGRK